MSLISEKEVLQATLDLACGRAQLESLSYHLIVECYEEILRQYHVTRQIQQRCFQVLLIMSAESEGHLTWYEKIKKINYYLSKLPQRKDSPNSSSVSPSRSRASFKSSTTKSTRSLSPNSYNVMSLTERGRRVAIPTSKVSTTAPSILHEGSELSMLLNNQNPSDIYQTSTFMDSQRYQSPSATETPKSILKRHDEPSYSSLQLFTSPQSTGEMTPKKAISFLDAPDSQESLKHIQERVDTMQEDSMKTRNLIAHLAYRIDKKNLSENSFVFQNPVDSPLLLSSMKGHSVVNTSYVAANRTPSEHSRNITVGTATPAMLHPEDLFSPVSKLNQSQQEQDDHELKYSITTPGLSPPMRDHKKSQEIFAAQLLQEMSSPTGASMKAVESAENTITTARQIRNYSQSLRQSSAMQKYLSSSDGGKVREGKIRINNQVDNNKNDISFEIQERPSGFDFQPIRATEFPPQQSQDSEFTPKKITNTLLSRTQRQEMNSNDNQDELSDVIFEAKDIQKNSRRENRSGITAAVSTKEFMGSTSLFRARLLSPNYASIDTLTIDPSYLPYDEANTRFYSSHAVASMKLFLLFQKWFIKKLHKQSVIPLAPTRLYDKPQEDYPPHYLTAMFYHHFDCIATDLDLPALSNLFGLEQWLREKVCAFIIYQTKLQLFMNWRNECFGKYAISSQYYSQKKFSTCFENWREYHVRLQLKFKNTILIYFIDQQSGGKKLFSRKNEPKRVSYEVDDDEYYPNRQSMLGGGKYEVKIKKRKKLFRFDDESDTAESGSDTRAGIRSPVAMNGVIKKVHFVSWKDWYQQVQLYHHLLIYRYHTMILPTRYNAMEETEDDPSSAARAIGRRNTSILPFYHFRSLTARTNKIYGKKPYTSCLQKTDFPFAAYQKYGYPAYTMEQYNTCLDQVFLYTQFRRFIHRTLYLRKAAYLTNQFRRKRPLLHIWSIMKTSYQNRKEREDFILQPMMNTLASTKQYGQKVKAFRKLYKNISLQRERRALYDHYRSSLLANKYCLVAVYMFSAPYYVRCFHAWKQNMISSGGLLTKRQGKLQSYYERYHSRKILRYWKHFRRQKQSKGQCFTSYLEWKYCWLVKLYQQALFHQMHSNSNSNVSSSSSTAATSGSSKSSSRHRKVSNEVMSIEQFDKQLIVYKQLMRRISCHYQHTITTSMDEQEEKEEDIRQQFAIIHYFQSTNVIHSGQETATMKQELCSFHQREVPNITALDAIPHLDMWMNYLHSYQRHHATNTHLKKGNTLDEFGWSYHQFRSKLEEMHSVLWQHYYNPSLQSMISVSDTTANGSQKRIKEEEIIIVSRNKFVGATAASTTTKPMATQQYLQLLQPNVPTGTNTPTRFPVYYHRHIPSLLRITLYKWQQHIHLQQYYSKQKQILQQKQLQKWFVTWRDYLRLLQMIQHKQFSHTLTLWRTFVHKKQYHSRQQSRFIYQYQIRKALYLWRKNMHSLYQHDYDNPAQHVLYNHMSGVFANHYKFEKLWYFIRQKCTQTTSAMPVISEKEKGYIPSTSGNHTSSGNKVVKAFLATAHSGGKGRYSGKGTLEEHVSGSSRHAAASLLSNPNISVFTRQMLSTLPADLLAYQHSMNQFILFKSSFPTNGNTLESISTGTSYLTQSYAPKNIASPSLHGETMMISSRHLKNYLITMKGVYHKYSSFFQKWLQYTNKLRTYQQCRQKFLQFLQRRALHQLKYYRNVSNCVRKCGRKIMKRSLFVWKYYYLYHKRTVQQKKVLLLGWNHYYRKLVYHKVWHRIYGYRIHNLLIHWKQTVIECNQQEEVLLNRVPHKRLLHHWKEWKEIFRIQRYRKERIRRLSWHQYVYSIQSSQLAQSDYAFASQYLQKKQLFQWKKVVFHNTQQQVLESYGSLWYHYQLMIQGLAAWYKFFAPKWSRKFDLRKRVQLWKSRIENELNHWKRQQYPYSLLATTATGMSEKQHEGHILAIGGGISGIPPYLLQWKEWKLYQHLKQYELQQFKSNFYRQKKVRSAVIAVKDTDVNEEEGETESIHRKPTASNFKMIQKGILASRLAIKSSQQQRVLTPQEQIAQSHMQKLQKDRNKTSSFSISSTSNTGKYQSSNLSRQQKRQYSRYEQQQKSLIQLQERMGERREDIEYEPINASSATRQSLSSVEHNKVTHVQQHSSAVQEAIGSQSHRETRTSSTSSSSPSGTKLSSKMNMIQRFLTQSPLKSRNDSRDYVANEDDDDMEEQEEHKVGEDGEEDDESVEETYDIKKGGRMNVHSSSASHTATSSKPRSNTDATKRPAAKVFTFDEYETNQIKDTSSTTTATASRRHKHKNANEYQQTETGSITPIRASTATSKGDLSVTFSPHHKEYIISRSGSSTVHDHAVEKEDEYEVETDEAFTSTMLSTTSPGKSTISRQSSKASSSSRPSSVSPSTTRNPALLSQQLPTGSDRGRSLPSSPTASQSSTTTYSSAVTTSIKSSLYQQHLRRQASAQSPRRSVSPNGKSGSGSSVPLATWPGPTQSRNNISPGRNANTTAGVTRNNTVDRERESMHLLGTTNGTNGANGALGLSFSRIRLEDLDMNSLAGSSIPSHSYSAVGKSPMLGAPGTFETTLTTLPSPIPSDSYHSSQPYASSDIAGGITPMTTPHAGIIPNVNFISPSNRNNTTTPFRFPSKHTNSSTSGYGGNSWTRGNTEGQEISGFPNTPASHLSLLTPGTMDGHNTPPSHTSRSNNRHPRAPSASPTSLHIQTHFPTTATTSAMTSVATHYPVDTMKNHEIYHILPAPSSSYAYAQAPQHFPGMNATSSPSGYFSLSTLHTQRSTNKHPLSDLSTHFSVTSMSSRPTSCAPLNSDTCENILCKRAWWKWQQYRIHHSYYLTIAKQHAYYTLGHRILEHFLAFMHKTRLYTILYRRCSWRHGLYRWFRDMQRRKRLSQMTEYVRMYHSIRHSRGTLRAWNIRTKRIAFQRDIAMQKARRYHHIRSLGKLMIYWKALLYDRWTSKVYQQYKRRQKKILATQTERFLEKKNGGTVGRVVGRAQKMVLLEDRIENETTRTRIRSQKNSIFARVKSLLHFPKRNLHYDHWSGDEEEKDTTVVVARTTTISSREAGEDSKVFNKRSHHHHTTAAKEELRNNKSNSTSKRDNENDGGGGGSRQLVMSNKEITKRVSSVVRDNKGDIKEDNKAYSKANSKVNIKGGITENRRGQRYNIAEEEEEEDDSNDADQGQEQEEGSSEEKTEFAGKTTGESDELDEQQEEEKLVYSSRKQSQSMNTKRPIEERNTVKHSLPLTSTPTKKLPRENRHVSRPLHKKTVMQPGKYDPYASSSDQAFTSSFGFATTNTTSRLAAFKKSFL